MNFYDGVVHAGYPLRVWARLRVRGRELIPAEGAVIIVANHDSMIDPLAVVGGCHPRRYLRFLAMAELWRNRAVGFVLRRMGHIPVDRGGGGQRAVEEAIRLLQQGEVVGIFPEGRLSRGHQLRARQGLAQLVAACPGTPILLAAVRGADDLVRFPKRPRVDITFFLPAPAQDGEPPDELPARMLAQIRALAPPVAAGRRDRLTRWLRSRRESRR